MTDTTVAKTILDQIGGHRRLALMVGAKNFTASEKALQFNIGKGAKDQINLIKVTLNGSDLYDVEFGRKWGTKYNPVKKIEGVYNDQLMNIFEETTGFFITFGAR